MNFKYLVEWNTKSLEVLETRSFTGYFNTFLNKLGQELENLKVAPPNKEPSWKVQDANP